jgi:hypothetical protein
MKFAQSFKSRKWNWDVNYKSASKQLFMGMANGASMLK